MKLEDLQKDYQKKLSEFSEAKRQLKKYEHKIYIEKLVSDWFFGDPKNDFGYAIWHICQKSSPTTNWNVEIIELMLEKGGNINHICEGKTPLDIYIFSSYLPWRMHKNTEKDVKQNIKILRKLGALTKEELDNQNK